MGKMEEYVTFGEDPTREKIHWNPDKRLGEIDRLVIGEYWPDPREFMPTFKLYGLPHTDMWINAFFHDESGKYYYHSRSGKTRDGKVIADYGIGAQYIEAMGSPEGFIPDPARP